MCVLLHVSWRIRKDQRAGERNYCILILKKIGKPKVVSRVSDFFCRQITTIAEETQALQVRKE